MLSSIFYFMLMETKAQTGDSTIWEVHKTTAFRVTGDGTVPNWSAASWLNLPQRNIKANSARRTTQIKLLYSDSGIYCLYRSEDPKITATLKEDFADLYNEDVVEAFFGPTNLNLFILNTNFLH